MFIPARLCLPSPRTWPTEPSAKLQKLGYNAEARHDCAKVSVVGGGIHEVPGVMANFVEALSLQQHSYPADRRFPYIHFRAGKKSRRGAGG